MVDDVQGLGAQVVGEEDVPGGFQGHLVALFLLQEDVLRLPLLLRQVYHHAVEGVDLQEDRKSVV